MADLQNIHDLIHELNIPSVHRITETKAHMPELVRELAQKGPILIMVHSAPRAVLLSVDAFAALQEKAVAYTRMPTVRSITEIKAHMTEIVRFVGETGPILIMVHSAARAVLLSVGEFAKLQEKAAANDRISTQKGEDEVKAKID